MCYSINEVQGLHALGAAVRDISGLSDPRFLFARVCSAAAELLGVDATAIGLVEDGTFIRIADCYGLPSRIRETIVESTSAEVASVLLSGEPHLITNGSVRPVAPEFQTQLLTAECPEFETARFDSGGFLDPALHTVISQPVQYGGMVIAVLYAGNRTADPVESQVFSMLEEFTAFAAPLIMTAIRATKLEQLARDEERQRITQHLHDTSLQLLFSISMSARALGESGALPPDVLETVQAIAAHAMQASLCMRDTFKSTLPQDGDLLVALRQLIDAFSARSSIPTQITYFGQPRRVPPEVDNGLVCTLREALHNVEKHAHASNVSVGLTFTPELLILVIQDDGIGIDESIAESPQPGRHQGLGLSSLSRRAMSLGGEFSCSRNDDGGTTVRVIIPTSSSPAELSST